MLDMIYDREVRGFSCSDTAKAIFRYTAGTGRSPQAVRNRLSLVTTIIDQICTGRHYARILTIAAGHLREAEQSKAFLHQRIMEWIAIDQDTQTVEECQRRYQGSVVRSVRASVRDLLASKVVEGDFDFVYAAGLFDYLSETTSRALLSKMYSLLRPAGKLLIANFSCGHVDAGYMEAFMNWRLIYRTEEEMRDILVGVRDSDHPRVHIFTDQWKAVIYGRY